MFHTITQWNKIHGIQEDKPNVYSAITFNNSVNSSSREIAEKSIMNQHNRNSYQATGLKNIPFSLPLKALKITSHFGYRIHPVTGSSKFHKGLDLQASYEPVFAVFSGVIEQAGRGEKEGYYMTVKHSENIKTIYCHLSKIILQEDDLVNAGQVIGISGNTGQSTGPHLHFAVKFKESYLDPVKVLRNLFISLE